MQLKPLFFHPLTVIACTLLAALVFTGLILIIFEGDTEWFLLYYFVPVGIPFVVFLFDRAKYWNSSTRRQHILDTVVIVIALIRSIYPLPLISGHTVFLVYALLTTTSRLAKISAFLILLQVAYLKLFVWYDATFIGGTIFALVAALVRQSAIIIRKTREDRQKRALL